MSVYPYVHPSIYLSIYRCIYLPIYLCMNLSHDTSHFFPVGIKLVLNIRLNRYLSIARQSDKMIRLICVNYADQSSDAAMNSCSPIKLETYLIKTKTNEVR